LTLLKLKLGVCYFFDAPYPYGQAGHGEGRCLKL